MLSHVLTEGGGEGLNVIRMCMCHSPAPDPSMRACKRGRVLVALVIRSRCWYSELGFSDECIVSKLEAPRPKRPSDDDRQKKHYHSCNFMLFMSYADWCAL
jgi:hypothetical protein